jgi:diguanylate cyclase
MNMHNLLAGIDIWNVQIPLPVALAVVATVGYLIGRRRSSSSKDAANNSKRALRHAQSVALELEKISWNIRKNLTKHQANVMRFKDRVGKLSEHQDESAWKELCSEAEEMLKPTLKLATQIANAYDEIRNQSVNLMTFTEVRTDPLTGVKNRRALGDSIQAQFALLERYETPFSLAVFDLDRFKRINDENGHLQGDKMLQALAHTIDEHVRETDVLARYGGDEFVVIMPLTELEGASLFSERLRAKVQDTLSVTISGGVALAQKGDSQDSLFSRADEALYQAKKSGRNRVYRHDGKDITLVSQDAVVSTV